MFLALSNQLFEITITAKRKRETNFKFNKKHINEQDKLLINKKPNTRQAFS